MNLHSDLFSVHHTSSKLHDELPSTDRTSSRKQQIPLSKDDLNNAQGLQKLTLFFENILFNLSLIIRCYETLNKASSYSLHVEHLN